MCWCAENVSEKMTNRLYKESGKAANIRSSRHSAAIVWRDKILAIGHNKLKSHPIMQKFNDNPEMIFLHAEMDAIVKTINRYGSEILSECSIYVMRVGKRNQICNSKPCEGCQKAIDAFGIKDVFWSVDSI
jgi:deoxycytidylate deaminase